MERFTFRTVGGTAVLYLGNSSEWDIISGRNNHEYKISGDAAERLAAYEDTGLEPEEIERIVDAYGRGHTLRTESAERLEIVREIKTDRLRELAKAEKNGRLEVLPCKVGDHILADGREAIVVWFFGYKTGRYLHAQFLDNAECADIPFYEIGKNRLPDREEADDAMKEANHA